MTKTKISGGNGKRKVGATTTTPMVSKFADTKKDETWKPCHLTDVYEVSTFGRVRRSDTKFIRKNSVNLQGYQYLTLSFGDKSYTSLVGRLVLSAFDRVPVDGDVAHHVDGNRSNDALENLKWTSIREAVSNRTCPLTIASRPVVCTSGDGSQVHLFLSALEASSIVNGTRADVYHAIRTGRAFQGYTFDYDASGDPTCEIKKIAGSNDHMVSADGRVRLSSGRWTFGSRHNIKLGKNSNDESVYRRVELTIPVNGKPVRKKRYVHVLVAEAFIGERPIGYDVDHIDGDTSNNASYNLQYVTKSENNRRACARGRKPAVEKPVILVRKDGTFLKFKSSSEGARRMGVNASTISTNCRSGRKNVSGEHWAHDKPVILFDEIQGPVAWFESLSAASEETGEDALTILSDCRNEDNESRWQFEEV